MSPYPTFHFTAIPFLHRVSLSPIQSVRPVIYPSIYSFSHSVSHLVSHRAMYLSSQSYSHPSLSIQSSSYHIYFRPVSNSVVRRSSHPVNHSSKHLSMLPASHPVVQSFILLFIHLFSHSHLYHPPSIHLWPSSQSASLPWIHLVVVVEVVVLVMGMLLVVERVEEVGKGCGGSGGW